MWPIFIVHLLCAKAALILSRQFSGQLVQKASRGHRILKDVDRCAPWNLITADPHNSRILQVWIYLPAHLFAISKSTFVAFLHHGQTHAAINRVAKNVTPPTGVFPPEVEQSNGLPFWFSPCTANRCPFRGLVIVLFVHAFVLFVGVLLFKMHSAEAMSCVLGCEVVRRRIRVRCDLQRYGPWVQSSMWTDLKKKKKIWPEAQRNLVWHFP